MVFTPQKYQPGFTAGELAYVSCHVCLHTHVRLDLFCCFLRTFLWQNGVALLAGAQPEDRMDEATSDPQERRSAEEVQTSQVHGYFYLSSSASLMNCSRFYNSLQGRLRQHWQTFNAWNVSARLSLLGLSIRVHHGSAARLHQLLGFGSDLWAERSAQDCWQHVEQQQRPLTAAVLRSPAVQNVLGARQRYGSTLSSPLKTFNSCVILDRLRNHQAFHYFFLSFTSLFSYDLLKEVILPFKLSFLP